MEPAQTVRGFILGNGKEQPQRMQSLKDVHMVGIAQRLHDPRDGWKTVPFAANEAHLTKHPGGGEFGEDHALRPLAVELEQIDVPPAMILQ